MSERLRQEIERARQARLEGRAAEARGALEAALAQRTGDGDGTRCDTLDFEARMLLANLERDLGDIDAARVRYEAIARFCDADAEPRRHAVALRHLADVRCESGDLADAERGYVRALAILREAADTTPADLANALRPYALLCERTGRPDDARDAWREARGLYVVAGIEAGVEECDAALARLDGDSANDGDGASDGGGTPVPPVS